MLRLWNTVSRVQAPVGQRSGLAWQTLMAQTRWSSTDAAVNKPPFDKILIANRGEIACRVIRTAKRLGIKTVAIYSEPDATAKHVRMADEAVCVGPAVSKESYLKMENVLKAVKETGAQAVHPGYGFLSENHHFVEALEKEGVAFIGPGSHAMLAMGDKIESKKLAKKAGVNVIPGFLGEVHDDAEVLKIANEIGYPVMIKASAGGGGKGMRIAWNDEEAKEGFRLSKQEAMSSFGDDRMLIEKFIDNPRHIEIQVLSDGQGTTLYFNERECSIQRRNQKVLEEAPSPFLDEATRKAMGEQAVRLAEAVGYKSAGTVEMLVDSQRNFYFLEMNTRLQVEHPITEYITGHDLVEHMIRIAAGEKLKITQKDIGINGWATEARVYAEDPFRNFLPSIGRLDRYIEPSLEGGDVRIDGGVEEGSDISVFYDPLICKLVTHGKDRAESIQRMKRALDSYVIRGVTNNAAFLRAVMEHPRYNEGSLSTKFIAEEWPNGFHGYILTEQQETDLVAAVSALHLARVRRDASVEGKVASYKAPTQLDLVVTIPAHAGTKEAKEAKEVPVKVQYVNDGTVELTFNGETLTVQHNWAVDTPVFNGTVDGREVVVQLFAKPVALKYRFLYFGTQFEIGVYTPRERELARLMPAPQVMDTVNFLRSPMPGSVISVNVKVGDKVVLGQELAVVEAMKMQNVLRSARDGIVKAVKVTPGKQVAVDEVLIEFEK